MFERRPLNHLKKVHYIWQALNSTGSIKTTFQISTVIIILIHHFIYLLLEFYLLYFINTRSITSKKNILPSVRDIVSWWDMIVYVVDELYCGPFRIQSNFSLASSFLLRTVIMPWVHLSESVAAVHQ